MRKLFFFFLLFFITGLTNAQTVLTPDDIYGELFRDVQLARIFPDSKTFVDCVPKKEPSLIVADYKKIKNNPGIKFNLKLFVEENFFIPKEANEFQTKEKDIVKHIEALWKALKRKNDSVVNGSSLLPLPYDYIVPGGRFREVYYWDTYFTMLGLKESGEYQLMESMVKNFAYLIDQYGHIPNGNRTYYLSRSQPPFFSLMLDLLAQTKGIEVYKTYLPALEKEYNYWMDKTAATKHVVKMPDGSKLNRYYDQLTIPRQESFYEDYTLAQNLSSKQKPVTYRHLRSAAESGWDFSTRWFKDRKNLSTIHTTDYIPVDLNCLLYHMEITLANTYASMGDTSLYGKAAVKRKKAINKYCWSSKYSWYVDYDFSAKKQSPSLTLAGMFPFFLQLADKSRLLKAKAVLKQNFLKDGGLTTTLVTSGQQWDAPNGWAPLQWVSIIALENYGEKTLAELIAQRWISLNKKLFATTGKLMEKYNVVDTNKASGGGEYPSQDGFGWTNGVLLALLKKYHLQ